ncbi:hypothetical protein SDSE159_17960 [Streptococcus dysgalactiae subsp. equisimilis]|nr:glutamyl-tRNA synthetase [Streptococcus dysgalactiae subsp. equisimilis 167]BCK48530.1 hypothetical protein SDSE89_18620 [Streptococcus dysgalactiae subsp. equisimilis]BCK50539.1 hypothetical protein SDSE159_17960 [Streptococcus dysgalactiae subsp. equisimilis]GET67681.1 hypothetical protein KNZ01_02150 [Streptococcus dysgalactiae subsp. equisimilis]GET69640.1 hypothetical protein KNZ03_01990 [Streptococcus dysgalactiae subsp. equisimilis]
MLAKSSIINNNNFDEIRLSPQSFHALGLIRIDKTYDRFLKHLVNMFDRFVTT